MSFAQNLVQNPDFEVVVNCPSGLDQVYNAAGWISYRESSDYFNACSSGVPYNIHGFQAAHSGNAYCGLIAYDKAGFYREIIGSALTNPLVVGQKYFISFFVSLTLKAPNNCWASDKLGAKFTNTPYSEYSNQIPINNSAHVYSTTIITDTVGWTKISGSFMADSAYQYIALGNFFTDNFTDTAKLAAGALPIYVYYYIDDVCVSTDSAYTNNWTDHVNSFSRQDRCLNIFPNPNNGDFFVELPYENLPATVHVYDVTGKIVLKQNYTGSRLQLSLESGLYVVELNAAGEILRRKVVVQR